MLVSLAVGEKFPTDIGVQAPHGRLSLAAELARGPLVVAFHRLWCPFCQQAARELSLVKDELDAARAHVLIVYREDIDTVSASCVERAIPFECVSDSGRALERAADVERFSVRRYAAFSPKKLIDALRSGSHIGKASSGFLQGRGTFVVNDDARIVYAHQSKTAADIPAIDDILAAVQSAARKNAQGHTPN